MHFQYMVDQHEDVFLKSITVYNENALLKMYGIHQKKESQPSSKLVLASVSFTRIHTKFSIKRNYESYLKIFA